MVRTCAGWKNVVTLMLGHLKIYLLPIPFSLISILFHNIFLNCNAGNGFLAQLTFAFITVSVLKAVAQKQFCMGFLCIFIVE